MLSYRHGFHAGNFADVHKHAVLCLLLGRLREKPAPFCVIDTHAGRGVYELTAAEAAKTGEWRSGIGRLQGAPVATAVLARYRDLVAGFTPPGMALRYPGSPAICAAMMREADRLIAIEMHPAEYPALRATFSGDRRVHLHRRDGLEGLVALVPPAERRGLALIDPSYEVKSEFETVPRAVAAALRRWASGTYLVWYPLLPEGRHQTLLEGLAALPAVTIACELSGPPPPRGLYGSGVAVVNPPYRFTEDMSEAGDEMAALLFGAAGRHRMARLSPPAKTPET